VPADGVSGSCVAPGVSTHDGLDREPCRERGRGCGAKKPSELAGMETRQHQEGEHSAGEQAHREQGRGEEVSLPDSLIEAHRADG
jgi:hypothetical protein